MLSEPWLNLVGARAEAAFAVCRHPLWQVSVVLRFGNPDHQ